MAKSRTKKSRTTIVINKKLWADFRIHAIKLKKTASQLLEEIIRKELGKT
jgi:hypothetical protein